MDNRESIIRGLVLKYFLAFSSKDIVALEAMFSSDITLQDWQVSAQNKDEVIQAIGDIFRSVNSINVKPINIFVHDLKVFGELEIIINNEEVIEVIDIIKFNNDFLIKSIKAYKG